MKTYCFSKISGRKYLIFNDELIKKSKTKVVKLSPIYTLLIFPAMCCKRRRIPQGLKMVKKSKSREGKNDKAWHSTDQYQSQAKTEKLKSSCLNEGTHHVSAS